MSEALANKQTDATWNVTMKDLPPPAVYTLIAAVSGELAKVGIAKDRTNATQGYKFRGIDEVYNALAPILAKHGLVILPRILSRVQTERQTAKGGVLFSVVVEAEFDFIAASDSSSHTVRTYGEAMDSADKATNKAMSAAYKYACMQAFCIPTEGDNDADAQTHTVLAKEPDGYAAWWLNLQAEADRGVEALRKAWTGSSVAYRQHLNAQHAAEWDALKAKAASVQTEAA